MPSPGGFHRSRYTDDASDDFSLVIPNTRSSAQFARIQFAAFLHSFASNEESTNDIIIAVGEALANAAEHGHRPNGTLSVRARRVLEHGGPERLEIEIADDGHGFAPHPHSIPDAGGSRGFGIHIMRSIMDSVEFQDGGRRVILRKHL